MQSSADSFRAMSDRQRKCVHIYLCHEALEIWNRYAQGREEIHYTESVTGTYQKLDASLPTDALTCAASGSDSLGVRERYSEPIAALQDADIEFPERITMAYYAIHSAFKRHALKEDIDDWLIVNQALAADELDRCALRLGVAIEQAT